MKNHICKIFETIDPGMAHARQSAQGRQWLRPEVGDHNIYRPENDLPENELPLKPAAVLLGLVEREGGLHVLLTKRSEQLKTHSGQVSFPGGKCDPGDRDAVATALREAEEEIGLTSSHVQVIGAMEDYETVTGFSITPVVGFVRPNFALKIDPNEVDDVFEVPLDFILDPKNQQIQTREWQGKQRHYYVFPHDRYHIWGATAAMLVHFSTLIREK